MKHSAHFLPLVLVPACLILLWGCGTGGNPTLTDPVNQASKDAVEIAITGGSVTLGGGEGHQFTAVVTGTSNTAVTWSVSGCDGAACGSITSTGYYTAPSRVSSRAYVQVVATSQANPSKTSTVMVYHEPIAVSVTPRDAWISPGGSMKFAANVQYDVNKGGVTWDLSCSNANCGTLSGATPSSVLYTAPAAFPEPSFVTLTATSGIDPNITSRVMIAESVSEMLEEGEYAFLFSGWENQISGGNYWPFRYTAAGHFHADGEGNILDGVEDISSIDGISQSMPFTGTYAVGSDRQGILNIVTAEQSATYRMVLEPSGTKARFIRFDPDSSDTPVSGAGYLELQDKTAFSLSALNGDYAMGISGAGSGHDWNRVAAVGRFTVDSEGAFTNGRMDTLQQVYSGTQLSNYSTNLALTGSLGNPSSATGRGTASLAVFTEQNQAPVNLNFVYYVVSNDKLLLIQTDARNVDYAGSVLSGEARQQHGTFSAASFSGPTIFSMAGLSREGYGAYYEHVEIGQMVANGSGKIASVVDDTGYGSTRLTNQAFYGTYQVASDGRSTMWQLGGGYVRQAVAYFYRPDEAFLMETSPNTDVLFGKIRPQATGSFDPSSITGTFLTVTAPPTSEESQNECGATTFDGEESATSVVDTNENLNDNPEKWLQHFELTGNYDVAPNGRGTLTFPSQGRTVVFWVVSPTEMIGNAAMSMDGSKDADWTALLEFTR